MPMQNNNNMAHPQEHLPIEEITSPIGAQMFDFNYDSELFPETLQNSEVASSSNCCYEEHSSYPTPDLSAVDINSYNTILDNDVNPAATTAATTTTNTASSLSAFLDDQIDNDISASIDFTLSPSLIPFSDNNNDQQYNNNNSNNNDPEPPCQLNNQISLADTVDGSMYTAHQHYPPELPMPSAGPLIPAGFRDELLMRCVPSFIHLRTSSSPVCSSPIEPMTGPYSSLPPASTMSGPFSFDNSGFFAGGNGLFLGSDLSTQELDFQGDNGGLFMHDSMARIFSFSSGDLQALSGESQQHLFHGSPSTTLASEISSLEDPTFKVGKLSAEERKRKIHRYMKKRNERNFSKKIKYACRKTLADSRPRVRGRFAKNDELGELARTTCNNLGDVDTDEDNVSLFSNTIPNHQQKVVKEAEIMESPDIFAQINGVNSFKSNYPIQSWI